MSIRIPFMVKLLGLGVLVGLASSGIAEDGYESAEYKVLEKDGNIEIREYPDLMLASTNTDPDARGRDGSFMRLFGYISGANEGEQKIAMTTPVFMEAGQAESEGKMGFVVPKNVVDSGTPEPKSSSVAIRKREGGRFAVIRFSGRMSKELAKENEAKLRTWMESKSLTGEAKAETAGYDAPFTPGPLRRNEVLIRVQQPESVEASGQ